MKYFHFGLNKIFPHNSGVCLKIAGYSHCHWTERQSRGSGSQKRQNRTVNYIGREDYVWTSTYFLGSEEGECKSIRFEFGFYIFQVFEY